MAGQVNDYFRLVDRDGNGTIDLAEFRTLLLKLGVHRSDSVMRRVFDSIDSDANGQIDAAEFSRWWASVESR